MAADVEQVRILLIEDDDGDAFLVEELLREAANGVEVRRARLLADAARRLDQWGDAVFAPFGLSAADIDALREAFRDWPR